MEQAQSVRHPVFPALGKYSPWQMASAGLTIVSAALIAVSFGYKVRGAELPIFLLVALLVAFSLVVVLFSKFLVRAYHEQHLTAGALTASEHEFESVFENALDAILILDNEGVCRELNPAAERLFGLERGQLLRRPIGRYFRDPNRFTTAWEALLEQKFLRGDAELVRRGQPVFAEFTAKTDCLPGQHVMIVRDVTERRRAQSALIESEERFRQMASNIREIFWMIEADTKEVLYVNEAYESITGRSCESLREDPLSYEEVIHPEDRVSVLAKLEEATKTGQLNQRFRIVGPKSEIRWVWVRGFPVRDVRGRIRRLVGTALDITAQKHAEEQVAANLAIAQSAWAEEEALRKATLSLTQDLHMDNVMDTLLRSLADVVPYTCARVLIPEGGPHWLALGERLCSDSESNPSRTPLTLVADECAFFAQVCSERKSILISDTNEIESWQTFNGHKQFRSWLGVPLTASEQLLGFLSIGHLQPAQFRTEHLRRAELLAIPAAAAIENARLYSRSEIYASELEKRLVDLRATERALDQSERGRRTSEEKFRKIFHSSPIPFSITTLEEGRFLEVNPAFESRYGYSRQELLGHTVHELGIWRDPTDRRFLVTQLQRGGPIRNVITNVRTKAGELKLTAYSADRIQFDGQSCIFAVSEDVIVKDARSTN